MKKSFGKTASALGHRIVPVMRFFGTLFAYAIVWWVTTDIRLSYVPPPAPYQVNFGPSDPSQMQLADYFTPFGGLPPGDNTSICPTGTATSVCNPLVLPGTLSIANGTGMIAFTGTGAGTITNTNTNADTFQCSATAGNNCYAFAGVTSGAGDNIIANNPGGTGYGVGSTGTRAFDVQNAAPTFVNTNAACTACITFDQKNQAAAGSTDLAVNDHGSSLFSIFSNGAGGGYIATGTASDTGAPNGSLAMGIGSAIVSGSNPCNIVLNAAVPETASATNGFACFVTTSVSTTHTSFQITFVGGLSYTTANPVCIVISQLNTNVVATITPSATTCAWTTTAAMAASQKFEVIWMGGKV